MPTNQNNGECAGMKTRNTCFKYRYHKFTMYEKIYFRHKIFKDKKTKKKKSYLCK